ncbi:hypothetical protein AN642_02255 [Epulopiscium sp. SCG-B10WGA-EpuloA2]|nr:hypothetical protein AN642_02255 [Epulopiscium sp. SCG-B10WGA-EpuloA2]
MKEIEEESIVSIEEFKFDTNIVYENLPEVIVHSNQKKYWINKNNFTKILALVGIGIIVLTSGTILVIGAGLLGGFYLLNKLFNKNNKSKTEVVENYKSTGNIKIYGNLKITSDELAKIISNNVDITVLGNITIMPEQHKND